MFFQNLPLSFSFAESTVLCLQVNCKTLFVVILNGICLLALNIRVRTLRENYSCNYKHQLKNLLKLNKWGGGVSGPPRSLPWIRHCINNNIVKKLHAASGCHSFISSVGKIGQHQIPSALAHFSPHEIPDLDEHYSKTNNRIGN